MNNEQKLKAAFIEALGLNESTNVEALTYNSIPEWDSIAHMALVAQLDDQFDIMLDTDDIIDISSFEKAKEVLSKYEVEFV
ncbi:acyl carrier protein [Paenibacillus hunanensis]|uniref:Acyl carrier protein n=1 Tax=Paenibacillus hunanensis TaxID=539262 RepID=A0ABU1ITQ5_9BACL|nr:acyl carrier protein [Paenibacillus hunanensis]MDR6242601.1 acyl carrier protein [Paenibacillus hunanensis]WPP42041.1 acyl carrier protein [Paenibacillus hunanensis]GGJ01299.1 acyl carrier protein [Paenibacillus hunanensis]